MASNVTVVGTDGFKFSRGFKMPNDENLEDGNKDWIKWGKDNLMCNFLNHIFYSSAYQSGIIRGKIHYIVGSGFDVLKGTQEELDATFGEFSSQDILDGICRDFELYNGFAIRVLRSLDGTKNYELIERDQLRYAKDLSGFWYSDDWSQANQNEVDTGLKFYPNYSPNSDEFDSVYVYDEKPKWKNIKVNKKDARNLYPQPVYIGALKSLMTDIEIQSFHLYNIINGMKVSGALNFANGEPENKSQFEAEVQNAITPTENSGGVMITYSDGDDRRMTWVPFTGDDLDKRYNILEKSVVQNIMSAHSITSPALFGIKTDGQLGGSTEMQDSYSIFVRTYVRGRQQVIEDHFNYVIGEKVIKLKEPEMLDIGEGGVDADGTPKSIQETALNGAQIASLLLIIENYNTGVISRDAAVTIITSSFPSVTREKAEGMVPVTPQEVEEQQFAQEKDGEDKVLLALMKCGRSKDNFTILSKNAIETEEYDFEGTEQSIKESFLDGKFATTNIESKVLDLVRRGNSIDAIIEALKEPKAQVQKAYADMVGRGLIVEGKVSTIGIRELAIKQPDVKLDVLYSYELRPDLPPLKTESREFCSVLMDLNRLYTRAEIDAISALPDVNRNVWNYRGGWYSDPTKPRPTPFCRHIWQQNLTITNG